MPFISPEDVDELDRHDPFWYCCACGAQNSRLDGECQYCECPGLGCKRDSCSGPCVSRDDHEEER